MQLHFYFKNKIASGIKEVEKIKSVKPLLQEEQVRLR